MKRLAVQLPDLPCILATWGATARLEETLSSDTDILCWTREHALDRRPEIEAALLRSRGCGKYLDLLLFDGSRPLEEWARATSTDYQAVLFANHVVGPAELVQAFARGREYLWSDLACRARQVWTLVAATLLHPRLMVEGGAFRPEKFRVGATRSFVTIAETYALLRGVGSGATSTPSGLDAVEDLLARPLHLSEAFSEAQNLRLQIEHGRDPKTCIQLHTKLGATVTAALAGLIELHIDWLQTHAGADPTTVQAAYRTLFRADVHSAGAPSRIHESTQLMLAALSASENAVAEILNRANGDWFVRYATTMNQSIDAATLHQAAFPERPVDTWTNRNVLLWTLRHPNVGRRTIELTLSQAGHRAMDYDAARCALSRDSI